jgi:PAS domain S-box-containing protein
MVESRDGPGPRAPGFGQRLHGIAESREVWAGPCQRRDLLEAVVDANPDAVFVKDRDGRYCFLNRAAARFLGKPAAEIVGRDDGALLAPEEAAEVMAHDRALLGSDRPVSFEETITSAEGQTTVFLVTKGPVPDESGAAIALFGIARDISEVRRAEASAQASAERAQRQRAAVMRLAMDEALGAGDLQDGLRVLTETACTALDVAAVAVWLLSADGQTLQCADRYHAALAEHSSGATRRVADDPAHFSELSQTGRVSVRQSRNDVATAEPAEGERPSTSAVAVHEAAVHLGGGLVGLVSLEDSSRSHGWRADEEAFAATVASLVAQMLLGSRRRQVELALRQSEEKFRALVETTSDWIWETGPDGTYFYASPRVRELLGYEPSEILGRTPFSLMPPEEAERVRAEFECARRERRPIVELRNLNVHRNGQVVVLETSGSPILDAQGALLGFRGIDRDITRRTRAEEALREREAFIQAFLDTSRDWIWAIDLGGVHTYSNPAVRAILGYAASDIVGRFAREFIAPEDRALVETEVARCIRDRCGWSNLVVRWRHQDGSHRFLESNAVPMSDGEGHLIGFRGVDRDITERRRAEAERAELERRLLHAQKLESLGVMAGGIAHDFNNILMAVLGSLDLALLELSPEAPVRAHVELAMESARRAAGLTRQMLAYSGRGRFKATPMDLNQAVRANVDLLRTAIPRNIELIFDLGSDPAVAMADPDQVQQVLMNLITNAAEAVGDGPGTITLCTGERDCDDEYLGGSLQGEMPPAGRYVFVEIADTGAGIDGPTLDRLFDPFFTTKFTGRGLGMSTVLGIVRGHGGAILVDSTVGVGTRIRVLFPAVRALVASGAHPVAAASPGAAQKGRAILVVDDEDAVRHACLGFVSRLGYRALGAADGEEAVRVVAEHSGEIACVLLDWTMPRMDGTRALAEIKRVDPNVKVVMTSGYDEEDGRSKVEWHALDAFLHKPFTLSDLRDTIDRVLSTS